MNKRNFILNEPGVIDLIIPLVDSDENLELFGLVEANKPGDYKVKVIVNHMGERTSSKVIIKGLASNGASVRIDGMVKIGKGAVKTDSNLTIKMLLLDKKSSAIVEPKLEIENNDVKASHAATVGKIDQEQMFYLMSRGLDENEAKNVLIEGFLKEIREKINR